MLPLEHYKPLQNNFLKVKTLSKSRPKGSRIKSIEKSLELLIAPDKRYTYPDGGPNWDKIGNPREELKVS